MGKRKAPLKPTFLSVTGELLITAGTILMLFVVWQVYINDPVESAKQEATANTYVEPTQTPEKPFTPITKNMKQGKVFGKLFIPRFGKTYERLIGQGTFQAITLNKIGPGHYLNSQWPGEEGNFAVAAHRTSHGAPFNKIDTLQDGDLIFVQTNDFWYTYKYLQTKIVDPTAIGVISKVPQGLDGAKAGGKYMTLTSCHPKWSNNERIIVWLELIDQQSTDEGKPMELMLLQRND
jgi:sortase A